MKFWFCPEAILLSVGPGGHEAVLPGGYYENCIFPEAYYAVDSNALRQSLNYSTEAILIKARLADF